MLTTARCRQSGDSKYQAKLSLDELQAFNDQMSSLPCKVKESELVQVRTARGVCARS